MLFKNHLVLALLAPLAASFVVPPEALVTTPFVAGSESPSIRRDDGTSSKLQDVSKQVYEEALVTQKEDQLRSMMEQYSTSEWRKKNLALRKGEVYDPMPAIHAKRQELYGPDSADDTAPALYARKKDYTSTSDLDRNWEKDSYGYPIQPSGVPERDLWTTTSSSSED
ncbi:hypothetical protein BDV95DRAFT_665223 [Massariosphaeria phaeospora]|uniref:Uncharacterized protein n=1 Tax=Massariosphaeria phaeospora TaxID=100035 RepID=A0A7C8MDV5_9PLEO|nr:hypothetical protein BDV95DRAFT_665223 [Massariosphaeria phaeospora]